MTRKLHMHVANILFDTALQCQIFQIQVQKVKLYLEMMTSCAVRIPHSSAALCNQTPWYLPRLQGSAVNRKSFYVETKMVGVSVWGFFISVLLFQKSN